MCRKCSPSYLLFKATNDDATSCKLSAVNLGYWRDPFVQVCPCPTSYILSSDPECNIHLVSSIYPKILRNIMYQMIKFYLADGKARGQTSARDKPWLLCSGCRSQVGHDAAEGSAE